MSYVIYILIAILFAIAILVNVRFAVVTWLYKNGIAMATIAIGKGMPIEQVQKLLGHVSVDTTLHYYGKQVLMESDVLKSA